MEEKLIKILLDKYFEGMTSLEEERKLKNYFATAEHIPEDIAYAKMIFGFFIDASQSKGDAPNVSFIEDCSNETEPQSRPQLSTRKKLIYQVASLAAIVAVVIVMGISFFVSQNDHKTVYCYINGEPITDMELAMQYTMATMDKISVSLEIPAQSLNSMDVVGKALNANALTSLYDMLKVVDGLEN